MYGKVIDIVSKLFDKIFKLYEIFYSKFFFIEVFFFRVKVKNVDIKFKWLEFYFNLLVKGQIIYDEVVVKVGKFNSVFDSMDYDIEIDVEVFLKDCGWDLNDGLYYVNVFIYFI